MLQQQTMPATDYILALIPLLPPGWLLWKLLDLDTTTAIFGSITQGDDESTLSSSPKNLTIQLLAYLALSIVAFLMTNSLVPYIKVRTFEVKMNEDNG